MARDRLLAEVLYQDEMHVCLCFHELMPRETMPSNQCMIIHRGHAAIMDPGGDLNFKTLLQAVSHRIDLAHLDFILASHQDPDIITSLAHAYPSPGSHPQCMGPIFTSSGLRDHHGSSQRTGIRPSYSST